MLYPQQTWSVVGEQVFDNGGYTLLNPSMKVTNVTFGANNLVQISINAHENNGVYTHHAYITYDNVVGETDVDIIVNAAMAASFPTSTVTPPLAELRA